MRLVSLVMLPVVCFAQTESTIILYDKPFATGEPVKKISRTELQTREPQPLAIDGKVSDEWFWIEDALDIQGYVRTSLVSKNLTVPVGTSIFQNKLPNSPILGEVTEPQALSILNLEGEWVSARYTGKAPLYFQRNTLATEAPAPLAQQPAAAAPGKAMTPQEEAMTIIEVPAAPVHKPRSLQPEAYASDEVPLAQYYTMDGKPIDPTTFFTVDTPLSAATNDAQETRYFEGRLIRNKGLNIDLILYRNREYEYILEGSDGKNLAYIDTNDLIHSTALEKYLKQDIIIHGKAEKQNASPPLVIHARYIQLK